MFEAVRTITALYRRADVAAMSECIATFGLDTLLYTKVRSLVPHVYPLCVDWTHK